jgi:hypothetical protein
MGQDGRRDEERHEDLYAAFDALGGQLVRATSRHALCTADWRVG